MPKGKGTYGHKQGRPKEMPKMSAPKMKVMHDKTMVKQMRGMMK